MAQMTVSTAPHHEKFKYNTKILMILVSAKRFRSQEMTRVKIMVNLSVHFILFYYLLANLST